MRRYSIFFGALFKCLNLHSLLFTLIGERNHPFCPAPLPHPTTPLQKVRSLFSLVEAYIKLNPRAVLSSPCGFVSKLTLEGPPASTSRPPRSSTLQEEECDGSSNDERHSSIRERVFNAVLPSDWHAEEAKPAGECRGVRSTSEMITCSMLFWALPGSKKWQQMTLLCLPWPLDIGLPAFHSLGFGWPVAMHRPPSTCRSQLQHVQIPAPCLELVKVA
jgi:hypothetical protein